MDSMGYIGRFLRSLKYHLSFEGLKEAKGFSYYDTPYITNELTVYMQRLMMYQALDDEKRKRDQF